MVKEIFRKYFPLILILWILFVLYPNPLNLVTSIHRFIDLDPDPGAVESILDSFPSDPAAIESAVLARIRYRLDWELYKVPWYFPSVEEVLARGQGDCKARALVLASILEAKGIPYQLNASPIHVWVTYENKQENQYENPQASFYQYDPDTGERQLQVPQIAVSRLMDSWRQQLWTPMPIERRVLLIGGSLALVIARIILGKKTRAQQSGMREKVQIAA
jgi:hypothetical protein